MEATFTCPTCDGPMQIINEVKPGRFDRLFSENCKQAYVCQCNLEATHINMVLIGNSNDHLLVINEPMDIAAMRVGYSLQGKRFNQHDLSREIKFS